MGRIAGLTALVAAMVAAAVWVGVPGQQQLRAELGGAPLLFALVYALVSLSPLPKTVFTLAAGAIYGVAAGVAVVVAGGLAGAVLAFFLGRWLGRDAVRRLLGRTSWRRVLDRALERRTVKRLLSKVTTGSRTDPGSPDPNSANHGGTPENSTPENSTPENSTPENSTPENSAAQNGTAQNGDGDFFRGHGLRAVLFARLIPVVPFTATNYLAGTTDLRLRDFAAGTAIGMLPVTTAYVVIGAYGRNPGSLPLWVAVAGLIVLTAGGWLADRHRRRSARGRAGGQPPPG